MRFVCFPIAALTALLFCAIAAPRAAAQSAGLADMPPPPSEWTPPRSSTSAPNSTANAAGESSSKPDDGESSSKLDPGESSSKSSADADSPEPEDAGTSAAGRPSLRRRGSRASQPASVDAEPVVPDQPAFDPLHAQRDLDVGSFYYKKGDYDAAIDRYQEAARLNPKMAKPYLLLGEVYEKRNNVSGAITSYRKYLDMYTDAPDKDKVLKRIEKLQGKSGDRSENPAAGSG